jgi:hypothetical protein
VREKYFSFTHGAPNKGTCLELCYDKVTIGAGVTGKERDIREPFERCAMSPLL